MQLLIHHRVDPPLQMEIGYHHILQAIIYKKLSEIYPGYGKFLHDNGYGMAESKRRYKLFTFSELQGHYEVFADRYGKNKRICFDTEVTWEIRSPDPSLIWAIVQGIQNNGITYGRQTYWDVDLICKDETVESDQIRIQMLQPLVLYKNDFVTGLTIPCFPDMPEFQTQIQENFIGKYRAAYGINPESGVLVGIYTCRQNQHRISYFKGTRIEGCTGEFLLAGKRKYLDFLYQTGLGSKNSQGFGLFRIL